MALFRQTSGRGGTGTATRRSSAATKDGDAPKRSRGGRPPLKFALYLLGGVALMALVGYLVAAVWLFPAPLLPSEKMVPRVVGMTQREATTVLEKAGFGVQADRAHHVVAPRGTVTWQDPPAGTAVARNSPVRLTVSMGPPLAIVPSVEGMDLDLATRVITAVGLHVSGVDTVIMKTHASALAARTDPAAGDSVPVGRGVVVHLAR